MMFNIGDIKRDQRMLYALQSIDIMNFEKNDAQLFYEQLFQMANHLSNESGSINNRIAS